MTLRLHTHQNQTVNKRPRVFDDTITGEWWKSSRVHSPHERSAPENLPNEESAMFNVLEISEPKSYKEAKNSTNWPDWEKAFEEEIKSLQENNVWQVVPRPQSRKVVGGKWVCKVKGDALGQVERFKARYVAKGFTQIKGLDYDETFAPVVRFDSLRILLAISASKRWKPRQLDIKTAFLYGILNEEIYLELPEGYKIANQVARLNRCIYGLKQSPRAWYFRLIEYILPLGFKISDFDPCVIIHNSGNLIVAIYVDDIVLFGEQGELMNTTFDLLKKGI